MQNVGCGKYHDLAARDFHEKRVFTPANPARSQRRGEVRGFAEDQLDLRTGAAWPAGRY
jgi:hypothetical protein